jgi:hypothetical protein
MFIAMGHTSTAEATPEATIEQHMVDMTRRSAVQRICYVGLAVLLCGRTSSKHGGSKNIQRTIIKGTT